MHYASPKHARRCRNVMRGKTYGPPALAALYLFTADSKLWHRWRLALDSQDIDWSARRPIDPDWDGIALEKAALSIAGQSGEQVTLRDLLDRKDFPQDLLRLVITALAIARNDPKDCKNTILQKGRKTTC
jgi:hypothetical protein